LLMIGCSMGANILIRYLALPSDERAPNIVASISISQAYDAERGAELLPTRYRGVILSKMKKLVRQHAHVIGETSDVDAILAARTCEEFDQLYTIPINDNRWRDAAHYYREASCIEALARVDTPLLLLNGLDDPLVPPPLVAAAHRVAARNRHVAGATLTRGGHLGFAHGWLVPRRRSFADELVLHYFEHAFAHWRHDAAL
jgi:predicted alpha/beta-fold hydrolase